MQAGLARVGHIDDHQPLALGGDIGIGARDIEPARIAQGHDGALDGARLLQLRHIQNPHALRVGDEQIAELQRRRPDVVQPHGGDMARPQRVIQIDHHQAGAGGDIGDMAGQGDVTGSVQHTAGVPGRGPAQVVVTRIAVGQGVDIHQDQALARVGDHGVAVDRVEGLFLVGGPHLGRVASRRDRLVGRQGHAGGVAGGHMCVIAQRREGRRQDTVRDTLVADRGYVIDPEPAPALGHEHVFPAQLQTARLAAGALQGVCDLLDRACIPAAAGLRIEGLAARPVDQLAPVALDVLGEEVGIGVALQIGAEHRLGFVPLGHPHSLNAGSQPDPGMHADKVNGVGPQHQQLGHDGVVVLGLGDMTVGAGLGLCLADRVREMRGEGLAREADRRDRRLLHIDPLAVDVGRGQDQGRGRAGRRDHPAARGSVAAKLEHVVTRHLRIVGGIVAGRAALGAMAGRLPVGLDRQVAAAAGRRP